MSEALRSGAALWLCRLRQARSGCPAGLQLRMPADFLDGMPVFQSSNSCGKPSPRFSARGVTPTKGSAETVARPQEKVLPFCSFKLRPSDSNQSNDRWRDIEPKPALGGFPMHVIVA